MAIQEYKCPNCSGAVSFDSGAQKMKCPYCDAEFEIGALQDYQKEVTEQKEDVYGWEKYGVDGLGTEELDALASNSCPSCGAEIIGDKNTVATVCPYCGNTQIVRERVKDMLKPDFVIPFKLDKKAAKTALEKFQQGKKLLPSLFKSESHMDSITALYVPFWLFDAGANAQIRYKATKTRVWSDSNYYYTKTNFYSVVRNGTLAFQKVPVDGSEKMDDIYMDSIEPFNYNEMQPFNTAYLSGYLAEKFDVNAEAAMPRANERIKATIEDEFRKSVTGYQTVTKENASVQVPKGDVHYALFPVWMLNTKYQGQIYTFAMNGQTGKLIGKLPMDKGKYKKYLFGITAVAGCILTIVLTLLKSVI
jgi:DNA-directed RNA polymerase subunit RPC12/RpoP